MQQSAGPPHVCPTMRHMLGGGTWQVFCPGVELGAQRSEQHSVFTPHTAPSWRHALGAQYAAMFFDDVA
jgi:hypothetical protein